MRNRLVGAVAVVAVAVLAVGTPVIASAAQDVDGSQELVDLGELNARAVTLSHSLADERDAMTTYVAAGRTTQNGGGVSEAQRARVDRQIEDLRAEAAETSAETAAFADAGRALKTLPSVRQQGLTGRGTALDTFKSYSATIQALDAISTDIARKVPPRALAAGSHAQGLPLLARATEQASATRGLLLAALASGGRQPDLSAAAQQSHVRAQAAVADFRQSADAHSRDSYDRTVNGTDVDTAERYLTRLTDQPRVSPLDLQLNRERIRTSLSTRIGLMRSVESSLTTADVKSMGTLRDDDVTTLEIRIGLVGLCLLLAVGISIWSARTMTQPLSALRRGAARLAKDPADEQPVEYKGRNDEYAQTVRSVNALHSQVAELAKKAAEAEGERARMASGRKRLAAERDVLLEERADLTERLAALRSGVNNRFVSLAMRTVGLIERQLAVIESLEEKEQDPERLDTLYKLDHFAARIRRNSENLLVLSGSEHSNHNAVPVPLLDVLRASISEIERYERVRIQSLPPHSQVAGFAADDVSHLISELLDNATAFSPPDAHVELSGWLLESGELMLSVQDQGIGMTAERMAELNQRLADPETATSSETVDEALGLGLYVVVRLAARHGVRVQLRDQQQGGVTAVVVLPKSILPTRPTPAAAAQPGTVQAGPTLPGSVAEANSNALPARGQRPLTPQQAQPQQVEQGRPAQLEQRGRHSRPEQAPQQAPQAPQEQHAQPAPAPLGDPLTDPLPDSLTGPFPGQPADPLIEAAERSIDAAGLGPDAAAPGTGGPEAGAPGGYPHPGPAPHAPYDRNGPAAHVPEAQAPVAQPGPAGPTGQAGPGRPGVPDFSGDPDGEPATGGAPAGRSPYVADDAPAAAPAAHAEGAEHSRAETEEEPPARRLTDMGLPKRTPRVVAQRPPSAPRQSGGVNAEALRRRLGGFQQGAREGRRDVAAEIAEHTAEQTIPQTDTDGAGAPGESHVVEEARD
ncbi:nitrate- and nitrite sensing domain-containing protein [Streptomyces niger]|uniref:nitrate- and nitrite sensing domain-containing protein n=1 Tax=Streptomyces niger TaxID=66373 RepID=UPI00069C0541|nr:nitrate- and nitrite sensing domain-containing protein [Streptomyces niger]